MVHINFMFRKTAKENGVIVVRCTFEKEREQITTGIKCQKHQWDSQKNG